MNCKVTQAGGKKILSGKLIEKNDLNPSSKKSGFSQQIKPQLCIGNLSLLTHLGRSSKERLALQEVSLSIEMEFPATPNAEKTDHLEDSLCYEEVCETLRNFIKNRQFHLIEKMARDCLSLLQEKYPFMRIRLTLHKKAPPVKGLKGGVTYTCGEAF